MTINKTQACVYLCQNLLPYHSNTQLSLSMVALNSRDGPEKLWLPDFHTFNNHLK